jgi:hypothetical protein
MLPIGCLESLMKRFGPSEMKTAQWSENAPKNMHLDNEAQIGIEVGASTSSSTRFLRLTKRSYEPRSRKQRNVRHPNFLFSLSA